MPIITCLECNHHPLSTAAEACPKCGAPVETMLLSEIQQVSPKATFESKEPITPRASIEPKKPPTRLDLQSVMTEFLRLSRPNASPYFPYLSAIADSQIEYWRMGLRDGNMDCAFLIAYTADNSDGNKEIDRLLPIAKKGHLVSLWCVGDELAGLDYRRPTYATGMQMLQQAASSGFEFAMFSYAQNLDCDMDDERQYARLEEQKYSIYEKLAQEEFPVAMLEVGRKLISSRRERDLQQGLRMLKDSAKHGCTEAVKELARMYENGRHVSMSMVEAEYWQKKRESLQTTQWKVSPAAYGIQTLIAEGSIDALSKQCFVASSEN